MTSASRPNAWSRPSTASPTSQVSESDSRNGQQCSTTRTGCRIHSTCYGRNSTSSDTSSVTCSIPLPAGSRSKKNPQLGRFRFAGENKPPSRAPDQCPGQGLPAPVDELHLMSTKPPSRATSSILVRLAVPGELARAIAAEQLQDPAISSANRGNPDNGDKADNQILTFHTPFSLSQANCEVSLSPAFSIKFFFDVRFVLLCPKKFWLVPIVSYKDVPLPTSLPPKN